MILLDKSVGTVKFVQDTTPRPAASLWPIAKLLASVGKCRRWKTDVASSLGGR
jgi:hypothetical protein